MLDQKFKHRLSGVKSAPPCSYRRLKVPWPLTRRRWGRFFGGVEGQPCMGRCLIRQFQKKFWTRLALFFLLQHQFCLCAAWADFGVRKRVRRWNFDSIALKRRRRIEPAAIMDIHRCRFVPYKPSAVNAVAFSHPKTKSAKQGSVARLAVGRANGDIEIWNPSSGAWHQELVIRGGRDRSIDGLVWVNEPDQDLGDGKIAVGKSRLFSIGYTSTVTEWDLEKGKPKRHASGQHGDIWCLAVQPPALSGASDDLHSNKLIAGTIDGELAMYSIEEDDLRFQRVVVRSPAKKAQMVSITFQSRKIAVVGCSDSTVRIYDVTKGHMLRHMTLGADLAGGSKDIIVWSVKCLPNGNIVSADSTGQVCIWDGRTYTQSQRLQSHKQDVLSLAISADGSAIISGGMDRRTVLYKQNAGPGNRWSKVWGRRYHDHDVKTIASFENGRTSVVVTGGEMTLHKKNLFDRSGLANF